MKKFFISILLIAELANIDNANAQKGFSVSEKAVPLLSFLQNKDDKDNSNYNKEATMNASFGAGVNYGFDKHFGVGIDALYSMQGQRYTLNKNEYSQKVNYIKIPLYFIYNSDASKLVSFIGKIGPQVSFVSEANFADKEGNKILTDTKDRYNAATYGGVAVAGTQYKLGDQTFLSTALRFDCDFTNAEDDKHSGYSVGRAKTYNSTLGLELGIRFMLDP